MQVDSRRRLDRQPAQAASGKATPARGSLGSGRTRGGGRWGIGARSRRLHVKPAPGPPARRWNGPCACSARALLASGYENYRRRVPLLVPGRHPWRHRCTGATVLRGQRRGLTPGVVAPAGDGAVVSHPTGKSGVRADGHERWRRGRQIMGPLGGTVGPHAGREIGREAGPRVGRVPEWSAKARHSRRGRREQRDAEATCSPRSSDPRHRQLARVSVLRAGPVHGCILSADSAAGGHVPHGAASAATARQPLGGRRRS